MSQEFKTILTAEDKSLRAAMQQMMEDVANSAKHLEKMSGQFDKIGKKSTQVDKVKRPLDDFGKTTQENNFLLGKFNRLLGFSIGGATVAGVVELNRRWAELGAEVRRTSLTLGVSDANLQGLRGGAEMVGLAAGTADAAIGGLGKTLQDAIAGRNQPALMALNRLGIGLKRTKDGAIDTMDALDQISDAIAKYKDQPLVQSVLAGMFGLSAALPMIRQGSAAMHKKIAESQKYNPVKTKGMLDRSEEEAQAFRDFYAAITGAKNVLADEFAPTLTNMAGFLADWLTKNAHAPLGTWGHAAFHPLPRKDDLDTIQKIWQRRPKWLGGEGWHTEEESTPSENLKKAKQILINEYGWSPAQAQGIVENIKRESGGSTTATNGNAYGIAQWMPARQADYERLTGYSMRGSSLEDQVKFIDWELRNTEKKAGDALSKTDSASEATYIVSSMYERPGITPEANEVESMRRANAAESGENAQVNVVVDFKNAPPWANAEVYSTGKIGVTMMGID